MWFGLVLVWCFCCFWFCFVSFFVVVVFFLNVITKSYKNYSSGEMWENKTTLYRELFSTQILRTKHELGRVIYRTLGNFSSYCLQIQTAKSGVFSPVLSSVLHRNILRKRFETENVSSPYSLTVVVQCLCHNLLLTCSNVGTQTSSVFLFQERAVLLCFQIAEKFLFPMGKQYSLKKPRVQSYTCSLNYTAHWLSSMAEEEL